ncbi:hypothetical protein QVD17_25530 [Tagetes erecta]|uniref:Uncharacterized protein n=1 Tax=Tagetes erecta TaxID=13708 RepID=A0AAD8KJ43_TARER|nr:hypothetical protein QVD17_25530 [Tagetes erecta]
MYEHEHPLDLVDLLSEQLRLEEVYYEENEEENEDATIEIVNFRCLCFLCKEEINWYHRYYAHLDCATSRNKAFMSILALPDSGKITKNYKDVEHPDLNAMLSQASPLQE